MVALQGLGKGPEEGGDVLHRVEPGQDAQHHVPLFIGDALAAQPFRPVKGRGCLGKIQPVVQNHALLRVKPPGDEHGLEQLRHGDIIVDVPQRRRVQQADGPALEGAGKIVQLIVAVDSGHHRGPAKELDQDPGDVGLCPVAVDDVGLFPPHQPDEAEIVIGDEPGKKGGGGDARRPGRIGEIPRAQAHQTEIVLPEKAGAQRQDMGLCPAPVAAPGHMDDLHKTLPPARPRRDCGVKV